MPRELHPRLIGADERTVVLNSPLYVPAGDTAWGEAAVRLALAKVLVERASPAQPELQPLPGASRVLRAIQTVIAANWALSDEEWARTLATGRSQLADEWASPFFTEQVDDDQVGSEGHAAAENAAYLVAAYVYDVGGTKALTSCWA